MLDSPVAFDGPVAVLPRGQIEHTVTLGIPDVLGQMGYRPDPLGVFQRGVEGYWSNLSQAANAKLLAAVATVGPREATRREMPYLFDIVYSSKREAALELLDIVPGMTCIDYGCMWGALSAGAAKRGAKVISVDQTYQSLAFLSARCREDGLEGVTLVQDDIRQTAFEQVADRAIVNGVLEWVPETGEVDLDAFYGKRKRRDASTTPPGDAQLHFLRAVHRALKPGGSLLLAIENRFDYTQFIGKRDPHSDLWFTSFAPRWAANAISRLWLSRPYVNYLYSFDGLTDLLRVAGFSRVEPFMCFPNYRHPELIVPYEGDTNLYRPYEVRDPTWRRRVVLVMERALMSVPFGRFFAPSIIAVATK